MTPYEKLLCCWDQVRRRTDFVPQIALVLGSGLGNYGETVRVEAAVDYQDLEGFPRSTVEGHRGRFLFGTVRGVPVMILQGRVHYYEGYAMEDVVLPVRLAGLLGAKILFLTNAAGGIGPGFSAGDFMMITDQISSFVPSPLRGPNLEELGPRFPDMSRIYHPELCRIIRREAEKLSLPLREGVYLQAAGPAFESPAEIRMFRQMGAGAVGMSTACEAVAARHMGMMVCGVSLISNLACGITDQPLSHQEVQEAADKAAPRFQQLVTASIGEMGRWLESGAAG